MAAFWNRCKLLVVLVIFGLAAAPVAQAQDYFYNFASAPASVSCVGVSIPTLYTSSFTVNYNLPVGAVINSYLVRPGGTATFIGSVASPGGSGSKVISGFSTISTSFPITVTLRYDTAIAGAVVSSSSMTFSCDAANVTPTTVDSSIVFRPITPPSALLPLTNPVNSTASASSTGAATRINSTLYAPLALFCSGTTLSAYTTTGTIFAWSIDLAGSATSGAAQLLNRNGSTLSKTADGRYSVLASQPDGKQYLFMFNGCPSPGAVEEYVSDPATGQFARVR
ncbi:MAG: hypothetical protein GC204_14895 [Chloroflexi bacterium]|nr:hypothetical protein [Chloroflexota bacterium]